MCILPFLYLELPGHSLVLCVQAVCVYLKPPRCGFTIQTGSLVFFASIFSASPLARCAMLSLLPSTTLTAPAADAVSSLPGYGPPPTPQYSGFLNASAAEPGTMLHYWFAATSAKADWTSAPTIVWFNGGPGSSSVLGMLQEQGPLVIDKDGKLMENPYAWTNVANLFVVESPAGVGYSYCAAMKTGGGCANSDVSTAKAAHAALQDFFTTKFPELR